ncbi:tetrahydromethanopterin S-methyltransferase subunit G [Methanotrichaceae archaeon M04Ac]|jgi:tetrahydromethanopterin S-methyltransferase subunit G|uniref:Tetrahydromethanopterin S-methyltransferase subunit G n=1 Tax=Candidatus Methanocrinis alkalitolerans TaxID=3033395 RepID=A0ABT5XH20_9EURY|nr:tetrahydromethanopterin S-methyltransferase subunit G [Candidatus Methanocrinis alkalitolerans]MDF0593931.1 tetrahydromethanopterin S-methyltransferase subunit G [Candidatus Methanocrinis alkalitolerans]
MAQDNRDVVPSVVVDQDQYTQVLEKLAKIDQKIEFVSAEMAQRQGKKIGRDIGILYGACGGIIIVLAYYLLAFGLRV